MPMDVVSILNGIKGKVLDAAHFGLLRNAYDLQNENIEQLKSNSEALRDSNNLLKERLDKLESEIARLKPENADLRAQVADLVARVADTSADTLEYQPTGLAKQILQVYRQVDEDLLFNKHAASVLAISQLEVEVAFSELTKEKVVTSGIFGDRGIGYYLTEPGKRLVLSLEHD